MKKILMLVMACMLVTPGIYAKKKDKDKDKDKKEAPKTTTPVVVKEGLFTVSKSETDWYLEVPDSLLGRLVQTVTRYTSTPVSGAIYGGEMANNQTTYWEKTVDNKLLLKALILDASADEKDEISKAVAISAGDPIIGAFKIESSENGRYRVNVTKFFGDETFAVSLPGEFKKRFNLGGLVADRSFITGIHTYPINTEVRSVKTYTYNQTDNAPGAPSKTTSLIAGQSTGFVTYELNTSFVLLPETPMQRRLADPRVGYFTDKYTYYADEQQHVRKKEFITRWRLEPKPEDVEKMKRGELVEPQKPIVFYIDPATPKQWRKYLIAGVNDWTGAFEQAGFKNAIMAKEWPENDSTMSMEDARYSVIRYLASPIENAYGPQVHDPRSGEIIESHICWYHNVMQLVHDWYMIQAGCIDERAQKEVFDEELMGDLIRFVSSHEVGHTLGLRHNMGSSSTVAVEKLRDKHFVEAHGHTPSIMDYARFNYVAQPGDSITKEGIYPRIGDYDKWAIEWGYKPSINNEDDEQDRLTMSKEIIKRVGENHRLWFGTYEPIYDSGACWTDPRSQSEDLGDNAIKASEYGIMNLKREVKVLPQWTYEEGDLNTNLERVYEGLVTQFGRYLGHVSANIGGVYRNYKTIGEAGKVYSAVEKTTQKSALDFLNKEFFTEPLWLVSESYVYKFNGDPEKYLRDLVDKLFQTERNPLVSPETLNRMVQYERESKDNYKAYDYFADLSQMIFSELNAGSKISSFRRYLQQQFVKKLIEVVNNSKYEHTDAHSIMHQQLLAIRLKALSVAPKVTDSMTKSHLADLASQIEKDLLMKK
ncbi:MAG: hypothetical protein H6Q13_2283 [Bacteroidetes bacterium]|nr:hypothetical protein [Bacteroidota bacterium]